MEMQKPKKALKSNLLKFVLLLSLTLSVFADLVPHDEAYFTKEVRNTQLIYTKDNLPFASQAAAIEMQLQPLYEKSFDYVMDETLHVGLISKNNQIANGFSTPYPNNRQINYVGGAMSVDYFSSTSWLNTLLYHESAHNYQVNAKDNIISSTLHSILGNGAFFVPWFIIPNITESSFLLEGNAVMNESWHGNGGRLYSGRYKATTLMQAKAGYLSAERVYNDNFYFLYGLHFYVLGGFYQKYLGETYGLKNVNAYWKAHSQNWYWPFFTNGSMQQAIGVDFETSLESWSKTMQIEAENLVETQGEIIATSQLFTPLNADKEEIYFIVNENGREQPELVVFDKKEKSASKEGNAWLAGKVIKIAPKTYATQASAYTSAWRIYQGLFDKDAFVLDMTKGKVIQGYLDDGRAVYFDVLSSFDQPQLYVGTSFYAQVNSSVFIDGNDLYYFVQKGKTRTLYKNKVPLFSIEGYYSYMSGVDSQGAVYFIANTKYGSGLFKYNNKSFKRLSPADTIIDARLVDNETALVAVVGSDAYRYEKIALNPNDEAPFEVTLFVEDKPYYHQNNNLKREEPIPEIDLQEPYYSFLAMNYSGTNIAMIGSSSEAGFIYDFSINFEDPLRQNAVSLFSSRNTDEYTLGGLSYRNSQYFLQYSISGYGVIDRPDENESTFDDERDFGLIVNAEIPFITSGHYYASLIGSYYQDYESHTRTPTSLSLDVSRSEQYGVSMYPYSQYEIKPYVTTDRDDSAYGMQATVSHNIAGEWYFLLQAQYSKSDVDNSDRNNSRGVKITKSVLQQYGDSDPSSILMPSLIDTGYVKSAMKGSASIRSVFNLSSYFFTFPISLRRESLYVTYNYYDLEYFGTDSFDNINETQVGLILDTLWMNVLVLPMTLEYIYNDNDIIAEENSFRFRLGIAF